VPATTDPRRPAPVLTPARYDDDVAHARHAVHNATSTYGRPPRGRRNLADVWHDFAHRYGWRAYALPVLIVVTVAALIPTTGVGKKTLSSVEHAGGHHAGNPAPPVASSSITLKQDAPDGKVNDTVLKAAALPPGAAYTMQGNGTFRTLVGHSPQAGSGQLYRYTIDVENGVSGVDLDQFQKLVVRTLSDSRSWSGHGVALQRVDSGQADFHITLTSAMTVRNLCGYDVQVETSCYAKAGPVSDVNRVVLNVARWTRGATAYVGDLAAYRVYMINHEDGHALGHMHAHQCLPGGLAPVMMQQTFGLRSAANGQLCEANPWPYPPGAKGAPGAEQPDTPQNDEYGLGD
jgi:hypothetical protein